MRTARTARAQPWIAALILIASGCSSGGTGPVGRSGSGSGGSGSGGGSSGTSASSGSGSTSSGGSGASSSGGASGSGGFDAGSSGSGGWRCADNGSNCLCYDPAPTGYTLASCPSYACCWADLTYPAEHDCECLNESAPCANSNPNPNAVAVAHCPP